MAARLFRRYRISPVIYLFIKYYPESPLITTAPVRTLNESDTKHTTPRRMYLNELCILLSKTGRHWFVSK